MKQRYRVLGMLILLFAITYLFLAGDSRTVAGISGGDSLTHAASR